MSTKGRSVNFSRSEECSGPMLVALLSTSLSYEAALGKLAVSNIIGPNAEESMALVDIHDKAPIRSQKYKILTWGAGIRLSWEEFKASPLGSYVKGRPIFMRDCLVPDGKNPSTRVLEAAELLGLPYDEAAAKLESVKDEVAQRMEPLRCLVDNLAWHLSSNEAAQMLECMHLKYEQARREVEEQTLEATEVLQRCEEVMLSFEQAHRDVEEERRSFDKILDGVEGKLSGPIRDVLMAAVILMREKFSEMAVEGKKRVEQLRLQSIFEFNGPGRESCGHEATESAKELEESAEPADLPEELHRVAREERKEQPQFAQAAQEVGDEECGPAQAALKGLNDFAQAMVKWMQKEYANISAEWSFLRALEHNAQMLEDGRDKNQLLDEVSSELARLKADEKKRSNDVMQCFTETLRSAYEEVDSLINDPELVGDQSRLQWLSCCPTLEEQMRLMRSYLRVTHMPFWDALLYWTRSRLDAALLLRLTIRKEVFSRVASTSAQLGIDNASTERSFSSPTGEESKEESTPPGNSRPKDREDAMIKEVVDQRRREEAMIEQVVAGMRREKATIDKVYDARADREDSSGLKKLVELLETIERRRRENRTLSETVLWEEAFPSANSTEEDRALSENIERGEASSSGNHTSPNSPEGRKIWFRSWPFSA